MIEGSIRTHPNPTITDVLTIPDFLFDINQELIIELRHDKTNKLSVRPAKTQISLGIRPV